MLRARVKPGDFVCVSGVFICADMTPGHVTVENCLVEWRPCGRSSVPAVAFVFHDVQSNEPKSPVFYAPESAPDAISRRWPANDSRKEPRHASV
jgi:hypothetical protein